MTCIPIGYLGVAVGLGPLAVMFGFVVGGQGAVVACGSVAYLIYIVRKRGRMTKP
jgi:hypothetical protein